MHDAHSRVLPVHSNKTVEIVLPLQTCRGGIIGNEEVIELLPRAAPANLQPSVSAVSDSFAQSQVSVELGDGPRPLSDLCTC